MHILSSHVINHPFHHKYMQLMSTLIGVCGRFFLFVFQGVCFTSCYLRIAVIMTPFPLLQSVHGSLWCFWCPVVLWITPSLSEKHRDYLLPLPCILPYKISCYSSNSEKWLLISHRELGALFVNKLFCFKLLVFLNMFKCFFCL